VSYNLQGIISLSTFRHVIDINKPYDTGMMFLRGNTYNETNDYLHTKYDLVAVPYILYQEMGTKFFDGNKGFISENTITELNQVAIYQQAGVTTEQVGFRDATRAKASMVSQGVIEEVKSYNQRGASNNAYYG